MFRGSIRDVNRALVRDEGQALGIAVTALTVPRLSSLLLQPFMVEGYRVMAFLLRRGLQKLCAMPWIALRT